MYLSRIDEYWTRTANIINTWIWIDYVTSRGLTCGKTVLQNLKVVLLCIIWSFMVSLNVYSVNIKPLCVSPACVQCGVQGRRMIPLLIECSVLQTKSSQCRGEWPGGLVTADGTTCNDRDSHIIYIHPHICIDVDEALWSTLLLQKVIIYKVCESLVCT